MEVFKEIIKQGKSAFHVAEYGKNRLIQAGFQELEYESGWNVRQGGRYVLTPFPSMLLAISIGTWETGRPDIRLAAAHTDSPCLKLKANPEMPGNYYIRANVEPYGGMLKTTWFDRPLGIAGKVMLRGRDAFHPETALIHSDTPVCVIPSLAPHLSRGGEKAEMNVQQELIPIFGIGQEQDFLYTFLEKQFGLTREEILDFDLYLYNPDEPETVGINGEFLSAPRIDNLASVAALIESMEAMEANTVSGIAVAAMFDNEEIGSRSKQGADSVLLLQLLNRLGRALGYTEDTWQEILTGAFLLSMDGAQGHHPNYPDKSDPTNQVYPGKGIVIKTSASQRYVSDSKASAIIKELCRQEQIPYQQQVNRSGMPGGQTLGPIVSSYLPVLGADVGIAMLAMHSAKELAAQADYDSLCKLAKAYYQYQTE